MQVVIIRSNSVDPDPPVEKRAKWLAEQGYSVIIYAWDREKKAKKNERKENIILFRFGPKAGFGEKSKNIINIIIWQFEILMRLLQNIKNIDVIHSVDFDTIVPSYVIARIFGKKIIYDVLDSYAHSRSMNSLFGRLINTVESFFARNSDGLILVDESRKVQIKGRLPDNYAIIYNTPEEIIFRDPQSIIKKSISYVGILQEGRMIMEMIEVIKKRPEWIFNIAGFGPLTSTIENISAEFRNIKFYGKVPYAEGLEISAQNIVMAAIYDPAIPNHRLASPNKFFEALMLGKILIVAENTSIDKIVKEHNLGFVINYFDLGSFEKVLVKIEKLEENELKNYSLRAKKLYNEKFNSSKQKENLIKLYNQI